MAIPEHFHFIFGLRPQVEPFHLAWYLCLRSCRLVYPGARISFHYLNMPHGPWWDRIRDQLDLVPLGHDGNVFDTRRYREHQEGRFIESEGLSYAHQADFLRLKILAEEGGVYADIDTLFVRPCPAEWWRHRCVMGQESVDADPPTLCNALIMAEPRAKFVESWLERLTRVFDGTWNRHSCIEPALLAKELPDEITVLPPTPFFHFRYDQAGLLDLYARDRVVPDELCSIHMWSHLWWDAKRTDFLHFHAGQLTEAFIRRYDTTYNRIARRYLD